MKLPNWLIQTYRSPWLLVGFSVSVAVGGFFVLLSQGFGLLVAILYAVGSFLAAISLLYSVNKSANQKALDYFSTPSEESLEERRATTQAVLDDMNDEVLKKKARKHAHEFWSGAFLLFILFGTLGAIGSLVLGPSFVSVAVAGWPVVITASVITLLFVRNKVALTFLFLAVLATVVITMLVGFEVILNLLPMLITFPMLMLMNMFLFMGPMTIVGIMQIKDTKPGDQKMNRSLDDLRGQEEAKQQILSVIKILTSTDESDEDLRENVAFFGPPGTGKTLAAEGIATAGQGPFSSTQSSAFASPFVAVGMIVAFFWFWKLDALANEFGWVTAFIDEAEAVFPKRGLQNSGAMDTVPDIASSFDFDTFSNTGDVVLDTPSMQKHSWSMKYPVGPKEAFVMFPGGMGMGGASMTMPIFLHKIDGLVQASFFQKLWRNKLNQILDILLIVPPVIKLKGKRISLRIPPAKAKKPNILWIIATNMPEAIDEAILRSGRFGIKIHFGIPGIEEREDIADLYASKWAEKSLLHPEIRTRLHEFAQTCIGFSGADIEQTFKMAVSVHREEVSRYQYFTRLKEKGATLGVRDERFFIRYSQLKQTVADWDKPWATWDSLLEAISTIRYGTSKPTHLTTEHRETVAHHETGHLLALRAFGYKWLKPTTYSIMPRGQTLGMVAFNPIKEHDSEPQPYWEAIIRMMLASIVAERLFYTEHQPGVVGDLENATRMAASMVGRFAMPHRRCATTEEEKYITIGKILLSSGVSSGNPSHGDAVSATLRNPDKLKSVYLILGQAFVDDYRLLLKNKNLFADPVTELLSQDALMGNELEKLWNQLEVDLQPLVENVDTDWPDDLLFPKNPFYLPQEVTA